MVLQLLQTGSESMEIGLGQPIAIYIALQGTGAGLDRTLQQRNLKQLLSILTIYLAYLSNRGNTYHALYSIWSLYIYHPQSAAFTEQILTIVHGFL